MPEQHCCGNEKGRNELRPFYDQTEFTLREQESSPKAGSEIKVFLVTT